MGGAATSHHEEEHIHLPEPSLWPFILAGGIGFLPFGGLLTINHHVAGPFVLGAGAVIALVAGLGWVTSVIKEKTTIDILWGSNCLSMAWKLFLLSEASIFGAFFGHMFYLMYKGVWPVAGTPHIHLEIPAIGTGILVLSSVTCELAHKALLVNQRSLAKNWMVITLLLGLFFLALQGYEWGYLMNLYGFYPNTSVVGTAFYLITGFHGFHVITGMLMLFMVYARMEMGSFDRKRHFSMNAASWYWHFVDVIWLFVFFTLYVGLQPKE